MKAINCINIKYNFLDFLEIIQKISQLLDTFQNLLNYFQSCFSSMIEGVVHNEKLTNHHETSYSLNWEFVNSQNKNRDVFELNMSRVCGAKEWFFYKEEEEPKSIKMVVLANGRL